MNHLPPDQRRVVELHHLKGLPVAEVAKLMDRTRPAVVGLLFRGLKKLRELLTNLEEKQKSEKPKSDSTGSEDKGEGDRRK